jgi:DNA polymerase-3 subunit delta
MIDPILDSIKRGGELSACLLYGEERFLLVEARRRIVHALLPEGADDLNCFRFEGEAVSVDSICEALVTVPLVPGRKVIVIQDTTLFASKPSKPSLPEDFLTLLEDNAPAAARAFMNLLEPTGWTLEDLRDGGWRKVPDDEWDRLFAGSSVNDYASVLPKVIALCLALDTRNTLQTGDVERLERLIDEGLPAGVTLILTATAVDKRKKLFRILSEKGTVLHFPREKSEAAQKNQVFRRAREYLADRGKTLTPEAMALLGGLTGLDYGDVFGEIDKLITYIGDEGSRIDRTDVESAIAWTREERIFELTEAVVEGDRGRALKAFRRLMERGVHPLVMLAMLARDVRLLMQVHLLSESGAVSLGGRMPAYREFQDTVLPALLKRTGREKKGSALLTGQHPYVIYNTVRQAGRFSWSELLRYLDMLIDTDLALKSTGTDAGILMERLILDLCGKRGRAKAS